MGATALAMAGGRSKELPLRLAFDSAAFFTYALPPIILDAGLRVDTRLFFHNILRIFTLGVFVTVVCFAVTSAMVNVFLSAYDLPLRSQLAVGAVFGATDTVATLGTLLLLTRALAVFPALAAGNMLSRNTAREQISRACACLAGAVLCLRLFVFVTVRESAVIWWAGSTRGAVSIAIATHQFAVAPPMARTDDPAKAELQRSNASVIAAATLIVLTSSICFSGLTRPFLARVLPSALAGAAEASAELYSSLAEDEAPSPRSNWLFRAWDAVDRRYLAPVLGSEASEHARLIHSGHTTELLERGAAEGDDNGDGMS